jgi:hypothetical protein
LPYLLGPAGANEQKPTVSPPGSAVNKLEDAKIFLTLIGLPTFLPTDLLFLGDALCLITELINPAFD